MTVGREHGDWPLTGRGAELAAAVAAARRTRRPAGVVLAGPAGVGATRLARETLATVRGPARWVAGSRSARSVPWGALAPLLGREPTSITAAVNALAGSGGAIGVDDAHLLDGATAAAVRHVAQLGRAAVVLTVRTGGPAPDAVTALWKDGTLPRIDLAPLATDTGQELVEAALGGPVDALTAARLFALTRGNPQLLRQVVEDEVAAGRLCASGGVWRWRGRFVPSARLFELVAAQADPGAPAGVRDAGADAVEVRTVAPTEKGADRALRAAVARLDVAAVERILRHAPDGQAVRQARRWVADVRGAEPADRVARAAHRLVVTGRPADYVLGGAASVRAALDVVNGRPDASDDLRPHAALDAAQRGLPRSGSSDCAAGALAEALAAAVAGTPAEDAVRRGQAAAAAAVDTAWLREDLAGVAVLALRLAGALDAAQASEVTPDLGPSAAATRAVTTALLALDRGFLDTAVRGLRAIAVAPGEPWIGWCGWAAQRGIGLAQALAMAGDPAGARAALDALRDVPSWLRPQEALADAWVAAAEGATSEAVRHGRRAADLADEAGQAAVEIVARHAAVRFGDRAGAERLAALADRVDIPRAAISAAHAEALARDDGPGLDAVAVRWAETGALGLAADAAAQAALAVSGRLCEEERTVVTGAAGRRAAQLRPPSLVRAVPRASQTGRPSARAEAQEGGDRRGTAALRGGQRHADAGHRRQ